MENKYGKIAFPKIKRQPRSSMHPVVTSRDQVLNSSAISICSSRFQYNFKDVINRMENCKKSCHQKRNQILAIVQANYKKLNLAKKKQKCILFEKDISEDEDQTTNQLKDVYVSGSEHNRRILSFKLISTFKKPPHRFKTRMISHGNSLFLFGGLGCEQNLTWAKFTFSPLNWQFPNFQERQHTQNLQRAPLYGHTMVGYHSQAFIYGGVKSDISNDLIIINLKNMQSLVTRCGPNAPYRRKDHVAHMLGRFMIVHGGCEGRQIKNDLFFYDTDEEKWSIVSNHSMPYRCSHGITSANISLQKNKKKLGLGSQPTDWLYLFGGKDQDQNPKNTIHRFRFKQQLQVQIEQIFCSSAPTPRYSMCFHAIDSGSLLLYGGRQFEQQDNLDQRKGVFRDIHLFNLEIKQWTRLEVANIMECRHSMASAVINGKMFIYGGCIENSYANGNLLMLRFSETGVFSNVIQINQMQDKTEERKTLKKYKLI